MRKPRDYKAEYARRKAKAKQEGYTGYGQKRRLQVKVKAMSEKIAQRIEDIGMLEYFSEETDWADVSAIWEAFRNYYAKAKAA